MTFHSPTETNPPFTTPPTWPFPTSAEGWEADYRLRLLEAAMIWMWTNGTGPGPPGPAGPAGPVGPAGPATAGLYAAVGTAPPPTNGTTINPPGGFLWVDNTPGVVSQLPPPVASNAPFTTYTDGYGKVWIAKGGVNGGAYKDPRDVLHAYVSRAANFVTTAGATVAVPWDTVANDPYGMWTPANNYFTIPLPGIYQYTFSVSFQNAVQAYCMISLSGTQRQAGLWNATQQAGQSMLIPGSWKCVAGDNIMAQIYTSAATNTQSGSAYNYMFIDYLGTG